MNSNNSVKSVGPYRAAWRGSVRSFRRPREMDNTSMNSTENELMVLRRRKTKRPGVFRTLLTYLFWESPKASKNKGG